jgi:hypothetical protein
VSKQVGNPQVVLSSIELVICVQLLYCLHLMSLAARVYVDQQEGGSRRTELLPSSRMLTGFNRLQMARPIFKEICNRSNLCPRPTG